MRPSSEDAQRRAFQQRHRALSQTSATLQQQQQQQSNEGASPSGGGRPAMVNRRVQSTSTVPRDQTAATTNSVEDDEFEEFHRSFTNRTNPLNTILNNSSPNGAVLESSSVHSIGAELPVVGNHQQPYPNDHLQRTSDGGAAAADVVVEEDPTVVQARRSMMARTGDRHARGKLPEPIEGTFQPPNSASEEPKIPPPRNSKRFLKQKQKPQRLADIWNGTPLQQKLLQHQHHQQQQQQLGKGKKPSPWKIKDDEHTVVCGDCQLKLIVKKSAILVRCEACQGVSAASSSSSSSGNKRDYST